ncbi:hypothetical protein M9H77_23726 [Catharanthus roseus]|uniref:Uncharacterized protein n=1 Tax=Catharanthus roseus TaxID=4058 RepID=A0ACC0AY92_CATRO|nr:hypothetical protein M9H77_23726 [Catharanthus roseus]
MSKVVEETLLDIESMIINRNMVTFLLVLDLMSLTLMIAMMALDLELEMVIMIHLAESYNYRGYNCGRSSQTLGTTLRPLSYNNLKLPHLCGTFGPYEYESWEQKVESLFYSYGIREEEKFQLVLKSLSYELNVWWNRKCENRKRIGVQPIKSWSLMKQSLRMNLELKTMEDKDKVKQRKNSWNLQGVKCLQKQTIKTFCSS